MGQKMAAEEYDGADLVGIKARRLLKLVQGTCAEPAVPAVLAARDTYLAVATLAAQDSAAAGGASGAREVPSCPVCFGLKLNSHPG